MVCNIAVCTVEMETIQIYNVGPKRYYYDEALAGICFKTCGLWKGMMGTHESRLQQTTGELC
jgi:hypothetical protein